MHLKFIQIFFLFHIYFSITSAMIQSSDNGNVGAAKEVMAGRQLYVYTAYKEMQIFHFNVPPLTSNVTFKFSANDSIDCYPRNITMYVTCGSYPVVAPLGEKFSPDLWIDRGMRIYPVDLKSNTVPVYLSLTSPIPGPWFVAGAVMEDSNRITQAGLVPNCQSWVRVEATYDQKIDVTTLLPSLPGQPQPQTFVNITEDVYFRFYVGPYGFTSTISIDSCSSSYKAANNTDDSSGRCPVVIELTPLALSHHSTNHSTILNCSLNTSNSTDANIDEVIEWSYSGASNIDSVYDDSLAACGLKAIVMEDAWHYVKLSPLVPSLHFNLSIDLQVCSVASDANRMDDENSTRETSIRIRLGQTDNDTSLDANETISDDVTRADANVTSASFAESALVEEWGASGGLGDSLVEEEKNRSSCWNRHDLVRKTFSGNFVFEFDLAPNDNGSVPLLLNVSSDRPSVLAFKLTPFMDLGGTITVELALYPFLNTSTHHYRLSACVSTMVRAEPRHHLPCRHGFTMHLNTSKSSGSSSLSNVAKSVVVPYPDPGPWYIVMKADCYRHINTSDNNSTSIESVPCTSPEVTTVFSVASSSCINSKCGKYGSCYQYIYSGYIFSTCVCDAGYKGWTCNDNSDATPDSILLLATLLLTLSNLAFLPAVILATVRKHYTEALVYTFTMVFSTLYHACDQQTYNWCLMKVSVLQFCDFYSAILAFWVTLIAMAELPFTLYSLLHMAGAMMVALGVEYDRTGLWVFVVPALSSFSIMALSWGAHTHRKHSCYPPKRYWLFRLLPGTLLAATGLICYAFLETHDNYQYVHSAWHITMALAILCLLPPKRSHAAGAKLLVSDASDCVAGIVEQETVVNGAMVL